MDRAEPPVAQELDGLAEHSSASPLRAGGHDATVAACRLDHSPSFDDVVADRLLAVDVLAGLTGPDRHQRMPVVGRGDRHGVDVAILEHATEVGLRFRIAAPLLLHEGEGAREMPFVDVDDMGDANVLNPGKVLVVVLPAAACGPGRMALVVP